MLAIVFLKKTFFLIINKIKNLSYQIENMNHLNVVARTVAARPLHAPRTVQYALDDPRGPPAAGAGPPGPLRRRRRRDRKWVLRTILATCEWNRERKSSERERERE